MSGSCPAALPRSRPPEQDEERRGADEGGDGTDRDLDRVRDDSGEGVGCQDEQGAGKGAHDKEPTVPRPDDRPHGMGHEQPDERNDADRGNARGDEQNDGGEGPVANPGDVDSGCLRRTIAERQGIE